jgi:hypothetical protein
VVGLGLSVGAVLHSSAGAQADTSRARRDSVRVRRDSTRRDSASIIIPARPTADSILRDTLAKRDSLHPKPVRHDTIQAPFARGPMPDPIEIGHPLVFDKASLFASGAVTLQDLLDRIPEITGLRSGWIAAPMFSSFMGDIRRLRVFIDGIEYDGLNPRSNGVLDLTEVPLWIFEELRIERGATEIRVYARTWRVDRTTAYTRTDISTGDQQTNMYRGYFGKRWPGGAGVQAGAQQYGTTPPNRGSASSDQTALMARVGWAHGRWSVDGFALRTNRNLGTILPQTIRGVTAIDSIHGLQSTRTDAYFRVGYGDSERGPWIQAIASSLGLNINHGSSSSLTSTLDTIPDTTVYRAQYVMTGGVTAGPLRLTLAERLRVGRYNALLPIGIAERPRLETRSLWTPSIRAEFTTGPLAIDAFAEGRGPDSLNRAEVNGRVTPLPFLSFIAAVGTSSDRAGLDSNFTSNFVRAEAAIRLHGLWFAGGVVRRDSLLLVPPLVFGSALVPVVDPAATGLTARIEGTLYQAIRANIVGIRWNDSSGFYRPRYETRSEIYLATNWLSRFPSGNFGVRVAFWHEYRSKTLFPIIENSAYTVTSVPDSRVYNFQFEVRIVSAILSYQFRNIRGEPYELVPGYLMPRLNQFYGVRWEFWN